LDADMIAARGFIPSFTVLSTPQDTTPPDVSQVTFSPFFIDTSAAGQNVTVTLRASDNLAGVDWGPVSPTWDFIRGIIFQSASGAQSHYVGNGSSLTRIAGTAQNGVWRGMIHFPRFSEEGTWNISSISLKDAAANNRFMSTADLRNAGIPVSLDVIRPSRTTDGIVDSGGGSVSDSAFGDRARIVFPPNVITQPTSVAIDVLNTPLSIPLPVGYASDPASFYVNVELSPAPSYPLPAPGLSVTLPLRHFTAPGTTLQLFTVDPVLGPQAARGVGGAAIFGVVGPTGLSVTFNNVVHFSVIVALRRVDAVLGDVNNDGIVNCVDLNIARAAFGKRTGQTGFDARADINRDGKVDVYDLSFVSRRLPPGVSCSTGTGVLKVQEEPPALMVPRR
jgi:hypothetical protein